MSVKVKVLLFIIILLILGYYAEQKGYLNIETSFQIGSEHNTGKTIWLNNNFTNILDDIEDHVYENVSLNVYVFNTIPFQVDDKTMIAYEAYIGSKNTLNNNPLDIERRIVFTYAEDNVDIETCVHLNGYIFGSSDVTLQSGEAIHPVYIVATQIAPIDCSVLS